MRRIHFDVTDSTNVQARRLAAEHAGERLLVTAAEQTAGRGRQGRSWHSPRGGVWLSMAWPLQRPGAHYTASSLAAAVAVRRAVCQMAPGAAKLVRIKWPNDVLVDDRKVAGILCEQFAASAAAGTGHAMPGFLIVGVGVNVDLDLAPVAGALRRPATTLRESFGIAVAVDAVVDAVAGELEAALARFDAAGLDDALLVELCDCLACVGAMRTWVGPTGAITGRVLGIDAAGRLLLETDAGEIACETGEFAA